MAKEQGYNGWTNYETWRVGLELFDGNLEDVSGYEDLEALAGDTPSNVHENIKEFAQSVVEMNPDLALSYALAFLDAVNWREIAEHLQNSAREELSYKGRGGR